MGTNGYRFLTPSYPGFEVQVEAASPTLIASEFFGSDFAADLSPKRASRLSGQQGPTSSRASKSDTSGGD
jgi:hypothetical protein